MAAAGAEAATSVDSAIAVQATVRPHAWSDRPVTVIAAAGQPKTATNALRRLAELSSRGCFLSADTTDHYVQYAQSDLVVRAVLDLQEPASMAGCSGG